MLLLTIPPAVSAPASPQEGPMRLEGAGVTFGPGKEPMENEARSVPFQALLSGRVVLAGGIPRGARWSLWRVPASALPALRKGAVLRPALGEALAAEWKPESNGACTFTAPWSRSTVEPGDRVVVELKVRGRRRALASSPIQSRLLPAARERGQVQD
jgi:hypothetical protein